MAFFTRPLRICLVLISGISLSGCNYIFKSAINSELQKSSAITEECRSVPTSDEAAEEKYKDGLTDLAKKVLYVSYIPAPSLNGQTPSIDARSIEEALADLKKDWAAIYEAAQQPQTKAALDSVEKDADAIGSQVKQIGDTIEQTAQKAFSNEKISISAIATAEQDFTQVVTTILSTIGPQIKSLEADIVRIKSDLGPALVLASMDPGVQTNAKTEYTSISVDLNQITVALGGLSADADAALNGTFNFGLMNLDFNQDILPVIQAYASYEIAKLLANEIQRGAVRIQHSLDSLNAQTLDVVDATEVLFGWTLEEPLAKAIANWLATYSGPNGTTLNGTILAGLQINLSDELLEVSCQRVLADTSTESGAVLVSSETVNSILETFILTYADMSIDHAKASTSDQSIEKDLDTLKASIHSHKTPLGTIIESLNKKLPTTDIGWCSTPAVVLGNPPAALGNPPVNPIDRNQCRSQFRVVAFAQIAGNGIAKSVSNLRARGYEIHSSQLIDLKIARALAVP